DNHMFFWAFESRNDIANDPVILWLTGGPGASSITFGALDELGACLWNSESDDMAHNPYAWNSNATVIFVDQPLSVGYSYGSKRVSTLRESTEDLYLFLTRLFAAQPDWAARDFYIAGESYGGSYVPSLGARILQAQQSPMGRLVASTSGRNQTHINLKGVLIGNGLIDQIVQRRGFYEAGCLGDSPVLNGTQCQALASAVPLCESLESACRQSNHNHHICTVSDAYCQKNGWFLINQTPWFPYDIRINCTANPEECQSPNVDVLEWQNRASTREELGVDAAVGQVDSSSAQVQADFIANGEVGYPSHPWVTQLLEAGVRVLIYVGNKDWLCNAPGMRYLVDNLAWHGQAHFRAKPFRPVHGPGTGAGRLWGWHKGWENLSFMEVDQAGHEVPKDQPEVALRMLNYWIARYL
ncbi:hypothetical protein ACHAPT_011268, partial [Fusarium lateritium]